MFSEKMWMPNQEKKMKTQRGSAHASNLLLALLLPSQEEILWCGSPKWDPFHCSDHLYSEIVYPCISKHLWFNPCVNMPITVYKNAGLDPAQQSSISSLQLLLNCYFLTILSLSLKWVTFKCYDFRAPFPHCLVCQETCAFCLRTSACCRGYWEYVLVGALNSHRVLATPDCEDR